ncbi:PH domain-containing protein [Tsukamurella sp. 1534]|uniref:PH domain-containing protein n=1 Tax=Tsukamurella sp. 1534 TaxID=1151061 RepID=UPI0005925460|nr:PH domain-containing protein [Tsukamurella sp. 1534]
MTDAATQPTFEASPRKIKIYAWAVAIVLIVGHGAVGLSLTMGGDTGPLFRTSDKIGMALIGVVLAGGALLFTRPRLRIGPDGVAVRNLLNENTYGWDVVQGFSFPKGTAFARLELPQDEYVSVWAIQARDGELAVQAIARARELSDIYRRG